MYDLPSPCLLSRDPAKPVPLPLAYSTPLMKTTGLRRTSVLSSLERREKLSHSSCHRHICCDQLFLSKTIYRYLKFTDVFTRCVWGVLYKAYLTTRAKKKRKKTSRLWNNPQCHGFHKKENITNSMIIFYIWMIFAQVKLFHCSGLMWSWALTKHCCRSARGPPIRLTWKRFNSEQSRLSLLWLLYTSHLCSTSSTQWETETVICVCWQLRGRLSIRKIDCQRRSGGKSKVPVEFLSVALSNLHTGMFLSKGSNNLQLSYFEHMKTVWTRWKAEVKPPHHIWGPKDNHDSWGLDLKQGCTHCPTGRRVYKLPVQ